MASARSCALQDCKSVFTPRTSSHRYCSHSCQKKAERRRYRKRKKEEKTPHTFKCRTCSRITTGWYAQRRYCSTECLQAWNKIQLYGIDLASYIKLKKRANGHCEICGIKSIKLGIDHCHSTGEVRGMLCFNCNTAIGKMGDDPSRLRKAAAYLKRHQKK